MDARASLRMSLGYDSPANKPMGLLGVRTCDRVDQNPEDTATVRAARSKAQGLWAEARLRGWQEIRPVAPLGAAGRSCAQRGATASLRVTRCTSCGTAHLYGGGEDESQPWPLWLTRRDLSCGAPSDQIACRNARAKSRKVSLSVPRTLSCSPSHTPKALQGPPLLLGGAAPTGCGTRPASACSPGRCASVA